MLQALPKPLADAFQAFTNHEGVQASIRKWENIITDAGDADPDQLKAYYVECKQARDGTIRLIDRLFPLGGGYDTTPLKALRDTDLAPLEDILKKKGIPLN